MRTLLILFLLFTFAFNVDSQTIEELLISKKQIENSIKAIKSKIEPLNDQLIFLDKKLMEINQQIKNIEPKTDQQIKNIETKTDFGKGIAVTINRMGGILRDKPSTAGNEIAKITAGETVLIFNWYKRPYFKAGYYQKFGYISYGALTENAEIKAIMDQSLVEEKELKLARLKNEEDLKLARLVKDYGPDIGKELFYRRYWIGMTRAMAMDSLGYPDDINTSEGSWGVHEQWVYSKRDLYLYFEDGILTSFQR